MYLQGKKGQRWRWGVLLIVAKKFLKKTWIILDSSKIAALESWESEVETPHSPQGCICSNLQANTSPQSHLFLILPVAHPNPYTSPGKSVLFNFLTNSCQSFSPKSPCLQEVIYSSFATHNNMNTQPLCPPLKELPHCLRQFDLPYAKWPSINKSLLDHLSQNKK